MDEQQAATPNVALNWAEKYASELQREKNPGTGNFLTADQGHAMRMTIFYSATAIVRAIQGLTEAINTVAEGVDNIARRS